MNVELASAYLRPAYGKGLKTCSQILGPTLIFFLPALLLLASCSKQPEVKADALTGRWNIVVAERNGQRSEYLNRGYFTFGKDGRLVVNLTGAEESGTFALEGNTIRVKGSRDFTIDRQVQDSLYVRFSTGPESEFRIILLRDHGLIH